MIPELYDELDEIYTPPAGQTSWNVDPNVVKANIPSHLIGYLADTMSCKVTEERNGPYELILTYPSSGKLFDRITPCMCIMVKANQIDDPQLFRIYRISKVLRGVMTVYARHISYDLSGIDIYMNPGIMPSVKTCAGWMTRLFQNTYFAASSTMTAVRDVKAQGLMSLRAAIGGVEGSVLDTFRGEFHFDNFVVEMNASRGSDKGIIIEYGKNMTEMTLAEDSDTTYTAIRPFAYYYDSSGEQQIRTGTEIDTGFWRGYEWTKLLDVTSSLGLESGEVPTVDAIDAAAEAWWDDQTNGSETLDVSTTEPSKYATLGLCDTVRVRHRKMVVNQNMKVVGLEYDTLLEKYTKITLGQAAGNLAGTVNNIEVAVEQMKKEKPIFTKGSKTIDLSGGIATVYDGTNTAKLTATGLSFNDGTASCKLTVIKRTMDSAGTTTITLERGVYLAITTHTNNTVASQSGLAIVQAYDSSSSVREIATAGNSTLEMTSATNLKWTTDNTYRALRLIKLT